MSGLWQALVAVALTVAVIIRSLLPCSVCLPHSCYLEYFVLILMMNFFSVPQLSLPVVGACVSGACIAAVAPISPAP